MVKKRPGRSRIYEQSLIKFLSIPFSLPISLEISAVGFGTGVPLLGVSISTAVVIIRLMTRLFADEKRGVVWARKAKAGKAKERTKKADISTWASRM